MYKVVPDEEPPAPSKYSFPTITIYEDSLHVEGLLLLLLHVLLLLLCAGENNDQANIQTEVSKVDQPCKQVIKLIRM